MGLLRNKEVSPKEHFKRISKSIRNTPLTRQATKSLSFIKEVYETVLFKNVIRSWNIINVLFFIHNVL